MALFERYKDYFDIDPEYYQTVNENIINRNPDLWKKFYPHDTFIKLIKDTIIVLDRKQKRSVWVEGAYGTGKSHAVLTLNRLLDASQSETQEYFENFNLDMELFNSLQRVKNSGDILTVHRYGSSSIKGDNDLIFAIQDSIENALAKRGIESTNNQALKRATIEWLSDKHNKSYFDSLIQDQYSSIFKGDTVEDVITKLETLSSDASSELMNNIFQVANERNIRAISLDIDGLIEWIKETIKENNLKAIVFIWDEFTEYFVNNTRSLTGFQEIVELSATEPFYLTIVTHKSSGLFDDSDSDKKKILNRFLEPTCQIELPENMAFRLMGSAMVKKKDTSIISDWEMSTQDLYERTTNSREIIKKIAKINDEELKQILPIHPYTALLLKQISSAFDSNQRSMFDFIKNDRGDEIKGFQWYIKNFGPEDDNPLLTVDLLWDFFYEKGKEYLAREIRHVLDYYAQVSNCLVEDDERRVLKAVLLMQAISEKVGSSVQLFIPNEKISTMFLKVQI